MHEAEPSQGCVVGRGFESHCYPLFTRGPYLQGSLVTKKEDCSSEK